MFPIFAAVYVRHVLNILRLVKYPSKYVRVLKGKQLELITPKSVYRYSHAWQALGMHAS